MRVFRPWMNVVAICLVSNSVLVQGQSTPPAQNSTPAAPPTAQAANSSAATPPTFYSWAADHASLSAGTTLDIILTAPPAECPSNKDVSLQKATVNVQAGLGVTATLPHQSGNCEMTVTLKADSTANQGSLRLTVMDASNPPVPIGQATIELISVPPGPVPPGYEPGVDASWQVEDYGVIKQVFGQNLANHYFAILITLGNDTGYDLLLDGVAFETLKNPMPPCSTPPNCPEPNPIPSETPMLLQGVVAYGQTYSARNIAVRSLQWASLLTTGFIPFFRAPRAAANYASAIAAFNGPFTTGFTAMFPDQTVQQLQRLGSSGVMGDSNELGNNSSARYLAFLSRSSLCSGSDKSDYEGWNVTDACGKKKAKDMKPALLTKYLGQLVVVGVKIPAANARFRVTANNTTATSTQLTPDTPAVAGVPTTITLSIPANSNLDLTGATVVPSDSATGSPPSPITKTSVKTDVTAHTTQPFTLQLKLKDGSTVNATISVTSPTITTTVQPSTVTFKCDQCKVPPPASTDWDKTINLTWTDSSISGEPSITSLAVPATITKQPKSASSVRLRPNSFPQDQGVTAQININVQ